MGNYNGFVLSVNPGTWADGDWHEYVLGLTAGGGGGQNVPMSKIAIQLLLQSAQPGGADPEPSTAIVYIDDIWLE